MTELERHPVTSQEFREVIGRFTSGVTVVSARNGDAVFATTASAVTSVSDRPPMLLVCMNRASETGQAIAASGRFAVNILGVEQHRLALQLARKGADKLTGVRLVGGATSVPLLQDALGVLECRVSSSAEAATHVVFLSEVDAVLARDGRPLVYFRGSFSHLGDALT